MNRLALILAALAGPASAHEAITGWNYDQKCCHNRDCHHIPAETVQATPDGWLVTLNPGDHPLVKASTQRLFRYVDSDPSNDYTAPKEAMESGDAEFHACVVNGTIICFYAAPMGA